MDNIVRLFELGKIAFDEIRDIAGEAFYVSGEGDFHELGAFDDSRSSTFQFDRYAYGQLSVQFDLVELNVENLTGCGFALYLTDNHADFLTVFVI